MPILENVGCIYSFSLDDGSFETGEHIFEDGKCFNCGAKERIESSISINEQVVNNISLGVEQTIQSN